MTAFGNDKVIAALERMLAEARKGQYAYLMTMMVGEDVRSMGGWYGSVYMEQAGIVALQKMGAALAKDVANKIPPDRPENVPPDRVCYNMAAFPASYDFLNWLIDAEMTRRSSGAPGPLKVGFWFGRDGTAGGLSDPARALMFNQVMQPMLALIGAVEDPTAIDGHCKNKVSQRDIVAMAKAGHKVPKLRPSETVRRAMAARYARPPVTITLREYGHFPFRNSKLEEWLKFAHYLKARGEHVIFVRDTTRAHDPVAGFDICFEASISLHHRVALYETAKMNLFVSNGPASLGFFSDWPWLIFMPMRDDDYAYQPNTPKFWREHVGIEMGGQFPWCRPHDQRIVWKDDLYQNLVEAWEALQESRAA